MAEDIQPNQGGNLNEVIQQTQQPTIERKGGYSPLVAPAQDAFPFHYQSPYIPDPSTNGEGQATASKPAPAVNPEQAASGNNTTNVTTTQQQQGGGN